MRKFLARFRQSPVFSTVYVLGAALSVASVMLVAIFLHVKTSNIYPEYSRDKMLYLDYIQVEYDKDNYHNMINGGLAPQMLSLLADTLRQYCDIGICESENKTVSVYADGKKHENITFRNADSSLFDIYDYEFIEGKPFTREDVEARTPKVVISDRLAKRLFGTDRNIVGRTIITQERKVGVFGRRDDYEFKLTVCGVFKEGSRLLTQSFAEMLIPSVPDESSIYVDYVGDNRMMMIPKDGVSKEQVAEVIRTFLNKRMVSQPLEVYGRGWHTMRWRNPDGSYNVDGDWVRDPNKKTVIDKGYYGLSTGTYPRCSLQMALGNPKDGNEEFNFVGFTKLYGVLILVLLLVPALNLSSLISGNMDSKMSEMGIRKAFGARNSTLLRQVLDENLWLTGCGAILGVILSWGGVLLWKDWLFAGAGTDGDTLSAADVMLDPAMLFAPKVFVAAVLICFVLNLLSTLIPAWWALRRPAIDSIKAKS